MGIEWRKGVIDGRIQSGKETNSQLLNILSHLWVPYQTSLNLMGHQIDYVLDFCLDGPFSEAIWWSFYISLFVIYVEVRGL